MVKAFLLLAAVGLVAWYVLGPKKVGGTISTIMDDVKVTFTPGPAVYNDPTGDNLASPTY